MKKIFLTIIFFSLLFISCKKDSDIVNKEINNQILIKLEVQHENGSSTFSEIYRIQ